MTTTNMSSTILRVGIFIFLAATLGLCRMIPFPRYNNYHLTEDEQDVPSNILISTQQNPDSNSSPPPPRIQYQASEQEQLGVPGISISRINDNSQPSSPFDDPRSDYNPEPKCSTPSLELIHARRALKKLKDLLGPETLRDLLKDDIAEGNAQWHSILSSSSYPFHSPPDSDSKVNLKLSEVRLLATQPCSSSTTVNFTSANFLAWFLTSAFTPSSPNLWAGHPEHYGIKLSPNPDKTLRGEILEPWGPLMTDSYVPRFVPLSGPPGSPTGKRKPWMKEHAQFPLQMVGDETLMDGTEKVIANLHYVYRDVAPDEECEKSGNGRGSGVEAILAMWMPDNTPDEVVKGLSEHLEVEYYNWLRWAYEDMRNGVFLPN